MCSIPKAVRFFGFALIVVSGVPAHAAPKGVDTRPASMDKPADDAEAPQLSGKSSSTGADSEKARRILEELCKQRGADATVDRLGPMLWAGEDAINKGDCFR